MLARWTVCVVLSLSLLSCGRQPQRFSLLDWDVYRQRFVADDGRVIDTGNSGVSHSEGQGYGLLLSLAAGDQTRFETIWNWTQNNLQVRTDHLFIWRRSPGLALSDEDRNNASDGDILIAWALSIAYQRWNKPEYRKSATAILSDIKSKLTRRWRGTTVLLPGAQGFEKEQRYTVNLSHWIYPAFKYFAQTDGSPVWQALIESGDELLARARFGRWGLPPDWLVLGNDLSIDTTKPPLFGYNAVRIPLYLVWANKDNAANLAPFLAYWGSYPDFIPSWTNLMDDSIDSYPASDGVIAVRNLVFYTAGKRAIKSELSVAGKQDYYSASLILLSRIAAYRDL